MKRILFVDDERFVLEALQRSLYFMRDDWEMRFAGGGDEALRLMTESPADVVISDMRMPQMNGAQLLNEVRRRHPMTVRLILSGQADQEMVLECIEGTHQFLVKPCNSATLKDVVGRALDLDFWVNNDRLKTVVSRLDVLPSIPSLYFEIMKEVGSSGADMEKVGAIIAQDPAMTAKMLQLVNSAFFGLSRQLTDPMEVVMQLGLEIIKSLVLGIHIFTEFKMPDGLNISAQSLWHHSLATATLARRIAQGERQDIEVVENTFTAGLLHDIGRLVLLANLPEDYAAALRRSRNESLTLVDAEREVFGATHAEVGGYLLGLWGLPVSLVETAVFHHCPGDCPQPTFGPLTIVHTANVLEPFSLPGLPAALQPQLDKDYLTALGVWDRAQTWCSLPNRNSNG